MSEVKTKKALSEFVNSGMDFAEAVKYCIQHTDGQINRDVVIALNRFITAYNEMCEMLVLLTDDNKDPNIKFN